MEILCTLLGVYFIILLIRIVMSWFPIAPGGAMEGVAAFFYAMTEPVLAPLRAVIPPVRLGGVGLDLSALVALFGLQIIRGFIC